MISTVCSMGGNLLVCLQLTVTALSCQPGGKQSNDASVVVAAENNAVYSYAAQKEGKDSVRLTIPNHPLRNEKDLDALIDQIGEERVVLLGEATHGVPSMMPKRYDAFIFIDNTTALHPIEIKLSNEPPDIYPSGS